MDARQEWSYQYSCYLSVQIITCTFISGNKDYIFSMLFILYMTLYTIYLTTVVLNSTDVDPRRVLMVIGHHSFVAVAFAHCVFCYRWGKNSCFKCFTSQYCCLLMLLLSVCRSKDSVGWELIFSTPYLVHCVEKMALNAKVTSSSLGDKMLAVSSGELSLVHSSDTMTWWHELNDIRRTCCYVFCVNILT